MMRFNPLKSLVNWLIWPLKKLYMLLSHKRVEEFALKPMLLPAKIISVGNIAFGGTGKTPTVIWIAKQIQRLNPKMKVGVHLRGYTGLMESGGGIVSDGKHILAGPVEAGDEAYLAAKELLKAGIPVGLGKHKAETGMALIKRFGLDALVMDDAFQFTSLKRDLDVVLIDATRPFGEAGFPREGMMREPLSALGRADVIILTRSDLVGGGVLRGIIDRFKPFLKPGTHVFLSSFIPKTVKAVNSNTEADLELLSRRKSVPLSAIGNPRGFERMLEKMGLQLLKPLRFADHHRFNKKDIEYINKQVADQGGHVIFTTEKDMVRLGRLAVEIEAPIYTIPIKFELKGEGEFLNILNRALCSGMPVKHHAEVHKSAEEPRVFAVKKDYERMAQGRTPSKPPATKPEPANVGETFEITPDPDWWEGI
jgi:tetraacyldisaccharide 4'-kinase